ncbi:MAG TPA: hypothetical protein VFC00_15220 [Micromonosporaceae bacterium]|nr:hypothetical protein [Micromonosporaceae bacterium]
MLQSYTIAMTFVLATLFGAQSYLQHVAASRPPVGVFNRSDVYALLFGVVVMPFAYLAIPAPVAVPVFGLVIVAIVAVSLGPVFGHSGLAWLAALALGAADLGLAAVAGARSPAQLVVNGVLLCVAIVGIANMWVQSGMRARHLMVVAIALTVYDTVATALFPITFNLFTHLGAGPFAPFLAWWHLEHGVIIGLGDLLVATLFVIVVDKGYGTRAAMTALAIVGVTIGIMSALAVTDTVRGVAPSMWVLGPVIVAYLYYLSRKGRTERTVEQYREAVPR